MRRRVIVTLPIEQYEVLTRLAQQEERPPAHQATYLLKHILSEFESGAREPTRPSLSEAAPVATGGQP